jgi:carbonic anhydrase
VHRLARGIHQFQRNYFSSNRQLFEQLATKGQHPETLFITCSDSRIVPNLITSAAPGELFIVRNIGNVVPRDVPAGGGVSAAIQYAVEVLEVESVIVCGHTQCGAIDALLHPERFGHLHHVSRWLENASGVREIVAERYAHRDAAGQFWAAVRENVLYQLENLRTFPFVAERLESGRLHIGGWVFDIAAGEVFDYDPEREDFVPLSQAAASAPPPAG